MVAVAEGEAAKQSPLVHHIGVGRHRWEHTRQRIGDKTGDAFICRFDRVASAGATAISRSAALLNTICARSLSRFAPDIR